MKKTLKVLILLSSIAGLAQAQSSVTVYGLVDLGLAHEDNGTTSVTRMDDGTKGPGLLGSRIGFKGTEDLGDGLSAIFQIESGILADNGAQADPTRLFNRQSFVGLAGKFGTVKLGRQLNPVYANVVTFDPFGDGLAGDSSRLFSYNGARTDNLITYAYAANGFRGELQYGLGEVPGNSSASRTVAGFVGYKSGPIDVVLTHQNIENATGNDSTKMTLLGGNYNFGIIKAFATYALEKGVVLGTNAKLDQRDALFGFSAPVGSAGTITVSYIRKDDKAFKDKDAQLIAIGYKYDLSKRTALYTSYGMLRNDDAASYKVVVAGNKNKLFNVGIRHLF